MKTPRLSWTTHSPSPPSAMDNNDQANLSEELDDPSPISNTRSSIMDDQVNLSEQLLLLNELGYSGLDSPYHRAAVRNNMRYRDPDTNREMRLLDCIAVALSTGKPGEVFAASFDKREQMQLVLAKNGPPTPDDIEASQELISLIGNPDVLHAMHIFPFLLRRCGDNMNKRIRSLHQAIQDEDLRGVFALKLQTYEPSDDIAAEFPGVSGGGLLLRKYGDVVPPFLTVWNAFVEEVTNITAEGLNTTDVPLSRAKYFQIFVHADAIKRSLFLKTLLENHNSLTYDSKLRAEKFKRRLGKICQYMVGITDLIEKAKRLFPIPHRWVTEAFAGSGENVFNICENPHDAVSRGLDLPALPPAIVDKLDAQFPSVRGNWERQQTMHASIHPELRIILHLGPPIPYKLSRACHAIGVSKRTCSCCNLWIESYNYKLLTKWMTSGSNDKLYVDWGLPGAEALACPYAANHFGGSSVDDDVLYAVSKRLAKALDLLFAGQMSYNEAREWERRFR
ncbi:hypothetical protein M413DRAFT_27128 [Hebeloma cylindrosporum]|uniref:Uncharacterized protein n=1 Tax=Hebeloma cylindrosporum TaxID=76867 RepID=A0A0C2XXF7_HEBCY|nr:hypothetical protein M413DRAFT_27128 [Hebeloma cylindrosporum h7]